MNAVLGGIASSLIGGIFGRSRENAQERARKTQLQTMVADAQAAGINPISALRAGAAANYAPPPLASQDALGSAIGQSIELWSNRKSIQANQEAQRLENQIRAVELEQLRSGKNPFAQQFGYNISEVRAPGPVRESGGPDLSPKYRDSGLGFGWEEPGVVAPVENVPLTFQYRTGASDGRNWTGLNADAWEIGVGELVGGGIVHGGAALLDAAKDISDEFKRNDRGTNRGSTAPVKWPDTRINHRKPYR